MKYFSLFIVVFVANCANFQSLESLQSDQNLSQKQPISKSQSSNQSSNQSSKISSDQTQHYSQIMTIFKKYQGTPYLYGGMDNRGFDCSGLINTVYSEGFKMKLPRTTELLVKEGRHVRRDQLKVGDIVFFKTSVKQLHAGVYIGDAKFIHASTSKGVIESSLNNDYWRTRYINAQRYL